PQFELEVWQTDSRYWHLFEPHSYLSLPAMIAADYYVGAADVELVAHLGVSPRLDDHAMRASRMVVTPESQGAGIGMSFLNAVCALQVRGKSRCGSRVRSVLFHTSHPGLCACLRRDPCWHQVSAMLYGGNKTKSAASIRRGGSRSVGYGGHFRAVQGFR